MRLVIRGRIGLLAVGLCMAVTATCQPVDRPQATSETLMTSSGQGDAGRFVNDLPGTGPVESAGGDESGAETALGITGLEPASTMSEAASASCEGDLAACMPIGDAGAAATVCIPAGPRDCSSNVDNDCDGQPDNVLDSACICVLGSVEPCDGHPGLDGRGQCTAGSRTCTLDTVTLLTAWGACEGSVGPGEQDSCTVAGDDTDCDGTDNGGCPCVEGETKDCGPDTVTGICLRGTQTCANGAFGACQGAVFPRARDCSSTEDNDCDGRVDNLIDNVCACTIGATQACGFHPGRDGNGQCRAGVQTCEGRAGNTTSAFGLCTGSIGPAPQDSCAQGNDGNCNGLANEGCSCINGETRACGTNTDVGTCQFGTQTCVNGSLSQCQGAVGPAPRNCASPQDNDCDGRADNTIDNVCNCAVGASRVCEPHPQDGVGRCRAGQQSCVAGPNNSSSNFGGCIGSVPPAPQDSCTTEGDDANCDGTANGACDCVASQGNGRCSGDASNSRCNGQGQCVPCQSNADCSLVSGGRSVCDSGVCVQDLAPPPPVVCGLSSGFSDLSDCDPGQVCCLSRDGSIGCLTATECPNPAFTVTCDFENDCPNGSVCCVDPEASRIECRTQAQCAAPSGQLCISSLFLDPFVCGDDPAGCVPMATTPAWAFCRP